MHYVYVIKSKTCGTYYVGSTVDIESRLHEHNGGKCRYTKGRRPWALVYKEEYATSTESRKHELFLKTGQGRQLLKTLVNG